MPELALHFAQDARGHQSSERIADDVTAEKEGGTQTNLVPFVPLEFYYNQYSRYGGGVSSAHFG